MSAIQVTTNTCESSNCVYCHLISSTDVSTAVSKLKTDKVNDNGIVAATYSVCNYCYSIL